MIDYRQDLPERNFEQRRREVRIKRKLTLRDAFEAFIV